MAAGRDLSQHSQWSLERKSKYARGAYFSLKKKKKRGNGGRWQLLGCKHTQQTKKIKITFKLLFLISLFCALILPISL